MNADCELCAQPGGRTLYADERLRVVAVDEQDYPGYLRIVWNAHVRELTDLDDAELAYLLRALCTVEEAQRRVLQPLKMNVASLGNMVPHLHWHLIPRHEDDAHFPQPVWGERQRDTAAELLAARHARAAELEPTLQEALNCLRSSSVPDSPAA